MDNIVRNFEQMNINSKTLPNHFQFLRMLGQGSFGRVFQVRKRNGVDRNKIYAIKIVYKLEDIKTSYRKTSIALTERNILSSIRHPFLTDLKYAFQTRTKLYFVMDFINGGDLYSILRYKEKILEEDARFFVEEILLALEYLHANNILYRDLKPENTLIDRYGHIKLTDFGLSKENFVDGRPTYSMCGTLLYSAPEVLNKTGHGKEADWWSLGILLHEMIKGYCPFTHRNKNNLAQMIIEGKFSMNSKDVSYAAKDLIKKLLRKEVSHRLGVNGAREIKRHKFFKWTSWDIVLQSTRRAPFVPYLDSDHDVYYFNKTCTNQSIRPSGEKYTISRRDNAYFIDFDYVSPFILEERH